MACKFQVLKLRRTSNIVIAPQSSLPTACLLFPHSSISEMKILGNLNRSPERTSSNWDTNNIKVGCGGVIWIMCKLDMVKNEIIKNLILHHLTIYKLDRNVYTNTKNTIPYSSVTLCLTMSQLPHRYPIYPTTHYSIYGLPFT